MSETHSPSIIKPGATICFHFTLKLAATGEIIDQTRPEKPAQCVLGDGQLLPGFEQALCGLKPGDQVALNIAPEQGFGQPNPNNIQQIPRTQFQHPDQAGHDLNETLQEGLVVAFADANKNEMPGLVKQVTQQQVTIDFNHPLAGKDLIFDVNILTVQQTSTEH